ncbi:hypothetical protein [Streptomyces bobili]|uniref:hypothetical protein n=1 Tax=Streptomyces bobili TaxID=67280 RepID=UPI002B1D6A12|nr:hypothetical protein [Streptomyces bobili]
MQNAVTNLGPSIGTALSGSIMIAARVLLTSGAAHPAVPDSVTSQVTVQLRSGAPLLSDAQLGTVLDEAGVSPGLSEAALDANADSRLDGLRAALAVLAFTALLALFFTQRIPSARPRETDRNRYPRMRGPVSARSMETWLSPCRPAPALRLSQSSWQLP